MIYNYNFNESTDGFNPLNHKITSSSRNGSAKVIKTQVSDKFSKRGSIDSRSNRKVFMNVSQKQKKIIVPPRPKSQLMKITDSPDISTPIHKGVTDLRASYNYENNDYNFEIGAQK